MTIQNLLTKIISNDHLHARWLNSLSYLEYRGARKILRSQNTENINLNMLQHIFEESKHALFFKKKAVRIGGQSFDNYHQLNTLQFSAVKNYFYCLDQLIHHYLVEKMINAREAYQLTSWLIEQRALIVYQIYNQLLIQYHFDFNMQFLLNEEEQHFKEVSHLNFVNQEIKQDLLNSEAVLFSDFTTKINKQIDAEELSINLFRIENESMASILAIKP